MRRRFAFALSILLTQSSAMAIDLVPLWDYSKPDVSEQRFRTALAAASGDDALILQTQIARTYGIRKEFVAARALLAAIAGDVKTAGPEARARHALETGRTYASATHAPESQTPEAKSLARAAYEEALATAQAGRLDGLAIDAIHMLAFVDTAPADQLKWAQEALRVVEASQDAAAKRWEASIRNNIGHALHQLGRDEEALAEFRRALELRERGTNVQGTRIAHWMIAMTLRSLGRVDEALAIQLRLEQEFDAANAPDPHVFEELEKIFRARGDEERAAYYAKRRETGAAR